MRTNRTVGAEKTIDAILGRMDLADKIGQCLVCNHTGTAIEPYHARFIREFRCGGLRVTPHIACVNDEPRIRKIAPYMLPGQYAGVVRGLQELALSRKSGVPLQIVTDQEGDLSVDFLRGGFSLFPSPCGLAATGDPALVRKSCEVVGRQLRAVGVNWIHSPVLDVNLNPRNPEIGMRSFSDDPRRVAEFGLAQMKGLLAAGVVATGKHFPGRGDSESDAHTSLDVLRVDRRRLDAVELLPYRRLIAAGLPAVMTAHNAYTALDDEAIPASVSKKIVTGLLREELGFDGVVTTDAIGMAGVMRYAGNQWNATVLAVEAGNDVVLVKEDEATTGKCFQALMDAVKAGRIPEARLDESVRRILRLKAEMGILDSPIPDARTADAIVRAPKNAKICREVFRRAAIRVRDRDRLLPLDPKEKVFVVEQYLPLYHLKSNDAWYHPGMFGEAMGQYARNLIYQEMNTPPTREDLARFHQRLEQAETVVFFNIFWRGSGSNRRLIAESVRRGKRVIVATNDLYDVYCLPSLGTVICTFGAVPHGTRIAAEVIYGKAKPGGKWPLKGIKQNDTVSPDEEERLFVIGHSEEK